jgi:protein-disulfide isomerase
MTTRLLALFSGIAAMLGLACTPGPGSTSAAGDPTPAAELHGEVITIGELDDWIKDDLFRRSTQGGDPSKLYELRKKALGKIIDERVVQREAETLGLTPDALMEQETAKRVTVSEADIDEFYQENKARMGEAELETIKQKIEQHLTSRANQAATLAYVASLRDAAQVAVHLDVPRTEIEPKGPSIGPEDAAVTIVEFSDYQCPYCKRAEPIIQQVLQRYPESVRFVFRHFPLDRIHPQARGAAEAAACADEQGRFWEFHEQLFAEGAKFDESDLEAYAVKAEVEIDGFRTCIQEGRTTALVEEDLQAGRKAGVTGTPAFFVNGIRLTGARPVEEFVELIEQEISSS